MQHVHYVMPADTTMHALSSFLQACIEAGARRAKPGEFTLRAFLNGRLDLSQVSDICGKQASSSSYVFHLHASAEFTLITCLITASRSCVGNLYSQETAGSKKTLQQYRHGVSWLQAEAVSELLQARTAAAADSALAGLQGGLGKLVSTLRSRIVNILAEMEVSNTTHQNPVA
jgi:hypothetical protein